MRKKILGTVLAAMFLCGGAEAMRFSQPVEIGSATATDAGFNTYEIKGAIHSQEGISIFGHDLDAI